MPSVDFKKITQIMTSILEQEGILDPDVLGGVHMVLDEITIEAIEEGAIDPETIDPALSELYDAYENYKSKPTQNKLKQFEVSLNAVGSEIGQIPAEWVAHALGASLKTADEWIEEHPRYAEGIYSAVTLIAQSGHFGREAAKKAKSLMIEVEELDEGKIDSDRLLQDSLALANLLVAA